MRVKKGLRWYVSTGTGYGRPTKTRRLIILAVLGAALVMAPLFLGRPSHASLPCPCNVFSATDPSVTPALYNQTGGIEVGMRFEADQTGYITGARFYKVTGMTGTHTASLWDNMGNRIAQATFSSESPTGWQQIDFSPVAVVANKIYTVSVYMADGNYTATPSYFTAAINNSPLIAPSDGTAYDGLGNRGQGDYSAGVSAYPTSYYNGGNYWVDVAFTTSLDTTAPKITSQTPVVDATNVPVGNVDITATFSKAMDPSTINSNTFIVKDASGNPIAGTVSYNTQTYVATFTANAVWQTSTKYAVTLKGGAVSPTIADMQGIPLAADNVWSFTTDAAPLACPCTLFNGQNPAGSTTYLDPTVNNSELGTKVVAQETGYITALRFYKTIVTPDTTHDGNIWDASGNNLASVTFTNESDYGWQEATLATPLHVTRGQVYVISYGMTTGDYQAYAGAFTATLSSPGLAAYPTGDIRNTTTLTGTNNSVYSTTKGTYPNQLGGTNSYYYIDAVFSLSPTYDSPKILVTQPTDKSYGVDHTASVTAQFDQALDATTVNSSTVKVYDSSGNLVSGTVSYDAGKRWVIFKPTAPFSYNSKYSASISSGIKNLNGINLTTGTNWSFTTGSPVVSDMNQGNGGPILVLTTSASAYGDYYAEILRTEGFNYFDVKGISTISSSELSQYKTVILSSMSLTSDQVSTLTSWVNGGGNLVAMRPDKKLAGLLGLSDTGSSVTNQYLRTNVATSAGMGIVDTPIQFKTTADEYALNGATMVANIYSDNATPTVFPAATMRSVGNGTAMAFTYDLAQSVIGLHQGNKAWSGTDRTGDGIIRSNDLFYGAKTGDIQPDWLDVTKMSIPQADEQQRLLANMITEAMKKSLPAPRFWYLPNNQKVALVMAGDDHAVTSDKGTDMILNNWLNDSTVGCSVADWQCVRASHYVYPSAPLTTAQASQYISYGFEIGDHPNNYNACNNYTTLNDLNSSYAANLASWRSVHPTLPIQNTSRFHCYLWGSWDMMPLADIANGVRYDLDTVAYPSSWIGTNSPIVTGSGMNMRLTDINGAMIDVRQGVTNFDNTTAGSVSIAAAFDNALGPEGYYGIFGSHYDMTDSYDKTLFSIAKSRNVPIISSQQALTWLDGRSSSNFSNLKSLGTGKESFTIAAAEGAIGLQAMVPVSDAGGTITSIQYAGQNITYQTNVIKGEQYAIFAAQPGDYVVTYSDYVASGSGGVTASSSTGGQTGTTKSIGTASPVVTDAVVSSNSSQPLSSNKPSQSVNTDTTTKPGLSQLATVAIVVGAVTVVGGGGAGIWTAFKRFRLK